MIRKIHIILAIIAGAFVFQPVYVEASPRESVRTELVVRRSDQNEVVFVNQRTPRRVQFVSYKDVLPSSSYHHLNFRSLLVEYQHHHSTL